MIAVVPDGRGAGGWQLVNRTAAAADVVAQAATDRYHRRGTWRRAVGRLRDADGELTIAPTGDGHYRWILADAEVGVIAESPGVHRDAEACRQAFAIARHAAAVVLGNSRYAGVRA